MNAKRHIPLISTLLLAGAMLLAGCKDEAPAPLSFGPRAMYEKGDWSALKKATGEQAAVYQLMRAHDLERGKKLDDALAWISLAQKNGKEDAALQDWHLLDNPKYWSRKENTVAYCVAVIISLLSALGVYKTRRRRRRRKAANTRRTTTRRTSTPRIPTPRIPTPPRTPARASMRLAESDAAEAEEEAFGNPWWNIPAGTRIFIDTCVLMEAGKDRAVSAWFDHLRTYTKKRKWTIVILNSVIRELDGLKNSDDEERSQASRAATALLGDLQRNLGSRFVITGAQRTPADDEFEHEMKKGDLLCTRDNNLALRINGVRGLRALGLSDLPRRRR